MSTIDFDNYKKGDVTHDNKGVARGKVPFLGFKELWFHTGTQCNLECIGCFEESSPTNKRLLFMTLDDMKPYVDQAVALGVKSFAFTGGEPFINPSFVSMLSYAADTGLPVTVLTNGTLPMQRKIKDIEQIANMHPNNLHFRISLDSYDKSEHNAIRDVFGVRTTNKQTVYDQAISGLQLLADLPVHRYIAGRMSHNDDSAIVRQQYACALQEYGLEKLANSMTIFPEFDSELQEIPTITQNCIDVVSEGAWKNFMCTYLRQVAKTPEGMRVFACTVTNDSPDFDYGGELLQSLHRKTYMAHHRCYTMCFSSDASCSVPDQ